MTQDLPSTQGIFIGNVSMIQLKNQSSKEPGKPLPDEKSQSAHTTMEKIRPKKL